MKTQMVFLTVSMLLAGGAVRVLAETTYASNVPEDPFSWGYYTYEAGAEFGDEGRPEEHGEATIQEVEILGTPLYKESGEWMYSLSLGYNWYGFEFEDIDLEDLSVYSITLPVAVIYTSGDWIFWGSVAPGVFSDLDGLENDDFRTLVHGLCLYAYQPNVQVAFGVAYDRVFGDDEVYPVGGVIWKIGEEWELNLLLPMPRVTYAPTEKVLMFADARPAGGLWNVEGENGEEDVDLQLKGYRLGLGVEVEVAPHVWLHLTGGASIGREYELGRSENKLLDSEADDTYFAKVGLVVR